MDSLDYKIQLKSFIIKRNNLTLTIMGEIEDETINSHFLSRPKIVLYFNNGKEDRRIPFVLSNVTYVKGKCFFSGKYTYGLEKIFWNTRRECMPFKLWLNFSFADYYEENIDVDLVPEYYESDEVRFPCRFLGNTIEFYPVKKRIYASDISRFLLGIVNFLLITVQYIFAIVMLPLFVIDGLLRLTLVKPMPPKFNDPNPVKKFFAFVFSRFSQVSTKKVSIWTVKKFIFKTLYNFYKFFKVQKNKITFISLRRNDISGNFAFVYDKLKKDADLKIDFILSDHTISEMSFAEIKNFTKACATSKVIILDEFTPQIHYIDLKPETKLIQLWHACGAFKTFGFTRLSKPKGSPQKTRNHRSYDYVTVSSSYCKKCHSEGFGISTNCVVPTGIPRTDVFFDNEYKLSARKKFFDAHPEFEGKKIVLFAPTFRGMVKEMAFYPTEMFNLYEICSKLPDDYVFIIKHHPFVNDVQFIPDEYKDRIIDLSTDPEINDLLFVTDVIITDYSSLVFEASLLKIPMIFYVFDLEKYINERDFYFDFKLYIPGKIVYTQEQLIETINNEDYCTERIEPFADMFFDYKDGKSTDRVVKLIYDCLK